MNTIRILFALLFSLSALTVCAQELQKIGGKILSTGNLPVKGAIITVPGAESVTSGENGAFEVEVKDGATTVSVWATGYFSVSEPLNGRKEVVILLVPENQAKYNETTVLPFRIQDGPNVNTAATNLTKKDFQPGSMSIDKALAGQVSGLRMVQKGGMPGEGAYFNLRGVRSLESDNAPLVVINGVPYLPDTHESQIINGYSRNFFQAFNIGDIQNITVLKGAEASLYGSMGSNGVILIETDGAVSDDLNTRISFYGQYGINWNDKSLPLLGSEEYKSYLSDIGMTYFGDMASMFDELNGFPFLGNTASKYAYVYNHNTDWQDVINKKGFVTDNLFRIEGGDEIAKYDISLGYMTENGTVDNTKTQRYHTQMNTNVLISRKVEMFASMGLAYFKGNYQEQGMADQTNPLLNAYARSPLLSPHKVNEQGKLLPDYAGYLFHDDYTNADFAVSNPLAIVNTLDAHNHQYDVNLKAGVTYRPRTDLSFTGVIGLFYNYNNEHLFVSGVTNPTIVPLYDQYGEAENYVRSGISEAINMYYNVYGNYSKVFAEKHALNVMAGYQAITTRRELDYGRAANTASDFVQTLSPSSYIGAYFSGYQQKWNWLNMYAHADYTYNNLLKVSVNVGVDGASSTGKNATRFGAFPSAGLTWMAKNMPQLQNSTWLNRLNIRAEYGLTGNSRYSSTYGKYYYTSSPYQSISTIVRSNIPNTHLKWETTAQMNLGADLSVLQHRIDLSFDYYKNTTKDVVFALPHSAVMGNSTVYDNAGKIENEGIEVALSAMLLRTSNFSWMVGGNIAKNTGKVKSLGGSNSITTSFADGAQVISRVGGKPYEFYGYQADGVYATAAEAAAAGLKNKSSVPYQAGDVRYVDQNNDGYIDDKDRISLGSAAPDFFGGFYTDIRFKGFGLSAEFTYSQGNKAYNAVRRNLESLSSANNQSGAVLRRWTIEGQQTDMPRADWGDPRGNNDFSSRWIEDASYLKLKSVTLSYSFDRKFLKIFRSGMIYVTGENLYTWSDYLGLDPEFSYSGSEVMQGFDYAKLAMPKTVKVGVNLKF